MAPRKEAKVWEFGDFQTPLALAIEATSALQRHLSFAPKTIIEPTCGVGSFLWAAAETFPTAEKIIGVDVDESYIERVRHDVASAPYRSKLDIIHGDFFELDWDALLASVPKPILVIGNPPWVTSADIGRLQGKNLPKKSNFQNRKGLDAVTGKANFDISEWMLIQHMDWLRKHTGCVAMLCKTAVARKILLHAWKSGIPTVDNRMVQIDAMRHFNAAVDACFFIVESNHEQTSTECRYFDSFDAATPSQIFGYHEGLMLSDVPTFDAFHDLKGTDKNYIWRSGIKHDCSKVMELRRQGDAFLNGKGDVAELEDEFVYPLLKSSDLANGRLDGARLNVIVTQSRVGEETDRIATVAPRTWRYLNENSALLDKRGSTIYKNKPRFSMFGIGPYAFAKWKVAISGFYKRLDFRIVGPIEGKPTMLDDTVYFLDCASEEEAEFLSELLNSSDAISFLSSMVFWSDKRPITVDLLKRLHIGKLAKRLGRERDYRDFVARRQSSPLFAQAKENEAAARSTASAPT